LCHDDIAINIVLVFVINNRGIIVNVAGIFSRRVSRRLFEPSTRVFIFVCFHGTVLRLYAVRINASIIDCYV